MGEGDLDKACNLPTVTLLVGVSGTGLLTTESLLHYLEAVRRQLNRARPDAAEGGRVESGTVPLRGKMTDGSR